MNDSKKTRDHKTIPNWVSQRNGEPVVVEGTEELKPISWDEFFQIFDERKVEFLYDDDKGSTFNKFVYS